MRKDYENWLRLVVLIDYGGKHLCYKILHEREHLGDGSELYQKLHDKIHKNKLHYRIHKEILCPSNKVIDEKKFDLLIYATVIHYMFGNKYKKLLEDVGDMRNEIFHMPDESICQADFEQLWTKVCNMLCKHDFHIELLKTLKTCDLFSVGDYTGIFGFISF